MVAAALGLDKLRVVETGGTAYESERQQWDSGNLVAITIVGAELGRGSGGGHCMTCPIIRVPVD